VSPSSGTARRSGDPRKRRTAPSSAGAGSKRPWVVLAALVAGLAVLTVALAAAQPGEKEKAEGAPDSAGLRHAEAACDLTTKAGEAAEAQQIDSRARYAAAVLLLDRAIIESERAAASDTGLADLDEALQAVHTAGHEGDPDGWQTALDTALTECRAAVG
jgi:hypothetical protein